MTPGMVRPVARMNARRNTLRPLRLVSGSSGEAPIDKIVSRRRFQRGMSGIFGTYSEGRAESEGRPSGISDSNSCPGCEDGSATKDLLVTVVREGRLELPRPFGHWILRLLAARTDPRPTCPP